MIVLRLFHKIVVYRRLWHWLLHWWSFVVSGGFVKRTWACHCMTGYWWCQDLRIRVIRSVYGCRYDERTLCSLIFAFSYPVHSNLKRVSFLALNVIWLEEKAFLRLYTDKIIFCSQLCLTGKRIFTWWLKYPLSDLLKRHILGVIVIRGSGLASVTATIDLIALPQQLNLRLIVHAFDDLLITWELASHGQLCHISLMHAAKLRG